LTDETNISVAYGLMPLAWSTGGVLGSLIGGGLSHPAEQFPRLFGNSKLLKEYPYLLPCAVPATFTALAWLVTFLFLKETVSAPLSFSQLLGSKKVDPVSDLNELPESEKPLPLRRLLTRRVIIAASNYAFLSLVDITFRAVYPVFLFTPIHLGGLGLPTSTIGTILSMYGAFNGIFQVFYFARIHEYLGSKKTFIVGISSALPAFVCFPLMSHLARAQGMTLLVWGIATFQILISIGLSFSYGAVFIYISAASPNRASLGATNGLSQLSVSVMRAIGPAAANSLFSLSIERKYLGGWLVYYVLIAIACVALVVASQLPRRVWVS